MDIKAGDIVQLKKVHPCGSDRWEVLWVGADVSIKCRKCHRRVMLGRAVFERRVKAFLTVNGTAGC